MSVDPRPYRVLVIGGYGFFGRRLVQRLARHGGLHITVCGRSTAKAQALVDTLRPTAVAELAVAACDVRASTFAQALQQLAIDAVVHTSGPFQGQDHTVARACIAAGAHCIDLADGREFVSGIVALDAAAREAGVTVLSGASSVPALSSAAADHLARAFTTLTRIDIGISPGNRTERGLSTVQGILSYCGKPLPMSGAARTYGWWGNRRHVYPLPVGARLLSPVDVPDLTLLPDRYPGKPVVHFGAGLELWWLHRGMNAMALAARWGAVRDWSAHAALLKRAGDWFIGLGSDAGAMHVSVTGTLATGGEGTRTWHLIAEDGDGPFVPTLAAAALIGKLQRGDDRWTGARPCVGVLTLDDFVRETAGLHIWMSEAAG